MLWHILIYMNYLHEVHATAAFKASTCNILYDGKSYRRRARSIEGLKAIAAQ
jgi:hypothetical protein